MRSPLYPSFFIIDILFLLSELQKADQDHISRRAEKHTEKRIFPYEMNRDRDGESRESGERAHIEQNELVAKPVHYERCYDG